MLGTENMGARRSKFNLKGHPSGDEVRSIDCYGGTVKGAKGTPRPRKLIRIGNREGSCRVMPADEGVLSSQALNLDERLVVRDSYLLPVQYFV